MGIAKMIDYYIRGLKSRCWVCGVPVRPSYPDSTHHSPLGGWFTLDGCGDCKAHRAVTQSHACWFVDVFDLDGSRHPEEPVSDRIDRANRHVDTDGTRGGIPVHVLVEGKYVPMLSWIGTSEFKTAMAEAERITNLAARGETEDA